MHKYLSAVIISMLAFSAHAKGKWEVGVAGGWGIGRTSETILTSSNLPSDSRYKFKLNSDGPVVGIITGYQKNYGKNIIGFNFAGYKDFYRSTNAAPKIDRLSDFESMFKSNIKRNNTWELSGKIGRKINEDTHLYGKIGVLRSRFTEQYTISSIDLDLKRTTSGWGSIIGAGIQKSYGLINIGLEYNFQYYEKLGNKIHYDTFGLDFTNNSKFRPKYHNINFRISRSF